MDPNAALAEIRDCANRIILAFAEGIQPIPTDVEELAAAARDLDEWLSSGGFLPSAWEKQP